MNNRLDFLLNKLFISNSLFSNSPFAGGLAYYNY